MFGEVALHVPTREHDMLLSDMLHSSDFQLILSPGTHKLTAKILQCTKKYIFLLILQKNTGIILIHSHRTAIVVLALVTF